MKNLNTVLVILIVVVGAGAFFGGMQYQKSQQPARGQFGGQGAVGQTRRAGGFGQNGGSVRGDIISADDKSLTVKMTDGSSKIVILSANTSITEASAASKVDLTAGKQVMVFGSTNSDGSVTAQNIQLNPQVRPQGGSRQAPAQ